MIKRIKIVLSYDGSKFYGSQIQIKSGLLTVTGELKRAFEILGVKDMPQASGRTDRGVHALNQVFHIDIPEYLFDLVTLKDKLNLILHPRIHIKNIKFVSNGFHARFDAKKRLYRYLISHNEYSPFLSDYMLFSPSLDIKTTDRAAKEFTGRYDFLYFRKSGSDEKSTVRTIYKSGAYRYKNYTVIYFLGDGFLRSQVRIMCDFILKIEKKELTLKNLRKQLNLQKEYSKTPLSPNGLYLSKIYY